MKADQRGLLPVIAAERLAIADMLDRLSPQQFETQSLCAGWTVRHVAAHLTVVLTHGVRTFVLAAIRAGGNLDRANRGVAVRAATRPIPDIVGDLRGNLLVSPKGRQGFAANGVPALCYVATDTEWAHGSGDEVSGPAAALALAISGRPARLRQLSGPGLATVRAWAGG